MKAWFVVDDTEYTVADGATAWPSGVLVVAETRGRARAIGAEALDLDVSESLEFCRVLRAPKFERFIAPDDRHERVMSDPDDYLRAGGLIACPECEISLGLGRCDEKPVRAIRYVGDSGLLLCESCAEELSLSDVSEVS